MYGMCLYGGLEQLDMWGSRAGAAWREGSCPPGWGCQSHPRCQSWISPQSWWWRPPDIQAPLRWIHFKQFRKELVLPCTERAVSWNPCASAFPPALNSTQRLFDWPVRMRGWVVEEQVEKTGLDFPISERLMVKVVEQSEGRDRRGRISRTRRVCPGDTRHRHSDSIWQRGVMYNDACKMSFSSLYYYYLAWSLFICYLRLWFLINTLFDLTSNLSTPDKKPDSKRRPDNKWWI